jgi:small GTP-binding protein
MRPARGAAARVTSALSPLEAAAAATVAKPATAPARAPPRRVPLYGEPPASATTSPYSPPPLSLSSNKPQRSLNAAVVGAPNAGKSTLTNALVGQKVSAVSAKYNTTRHRVLGVFTEGEAQVSLFDTPGLVKAGGEGGWRYDKDLVTAATDAVPEADAILFVVDIARRFDDGMRESVATLASLAAKSHGAGGGGLVAVANKCDLVRGRRLDPDQRRLSAYLGPPRHIFGEREQEREAAALAEQRRRRDDPFHRDLLSLKLDLLFRALEESCARAGLLGEGSRTFADAVRAAGRQKSGGGGEEGDDAAAGRGAPLVYAHLPPLIPVSACFGQGVDDLRSRLLAAAVPRPWAFGADMVTDVPLTERVAEAIREQLFAVLHREVPYQIRQETRSWRRQEEGGKGGGGGADAWAQAGLDFLSGPAASGERVPRATAAAAVTEIHQDLQVPSQHVARMLLGRGAAPLRRVAEFAKRDIERILGTRVRLQLHVTVKSKDELRRAELAGGGKAGL